MKDPATTSAPQAVAEPGVVRVLCHLGKLKSRTDGVEIDAGEADRNSNRWIFDVEHDLQCPRYALELVDFGTGKPKPGALLSAKFTPLDEGAAKASIWMPDPDGFVVAAAAGGSKGIIHYRVTIDATIYSTRRK